MLREEVYKALGKLFNEKKITLKSSFSREVEPQLEKFYESSTLISLRDVFEDFCSDTRAQQRIDREKRHNEAEKRFIQLLNEEKKITAEMSFKELLALESFKNFGFDDAFTREDGEQQFRIKRNEIRAAIAAAQAAQREKIAKDFEAYLASLSLPPTARYEDVLKNASGVKAVEALKEKTYNGLNGEALFKKFQRNKVEAYRESTSILYPISKEMHFTDKTPFSEFLECVKKKVGKDRIIYDIPDEETEKGEVSNVNENETKEEKTPVTQNQESAKTTSTDETNDTHRKQEEERKKDQDRNKKEKTLKMSNIKYFFEANGKIYREKKEAKIKQSIENKKRFFELLDKKRDLFSNSSKIEELRFLREYPAYKALGESERRILFKEYKKERNMIEDNEKLQQDFIDNGQEFLSSSSSESHSFSSSSSSSVSSSSSSSSSRHHSKRAKLSSTSSSSEYFSASSSLSSSSKSDSESVSSMSSGEYKEENEENTKDTNKAEVKDKTKANEKDKGKEREEKKKKERKEKEKEKEKKDKKKHSHHKGHSKRKRSHSSSSSSYEKKSHKKKRH